MTHTLTNPVTYNDMIHLRKATDLCFDHNAEHTRIRAINRDRVLDTEDTWSIPVEANRVHNYGYVSPSGEWDCFYMAMSAHYMDHIRSLVREVHTGDRLGFTWTRDNASPVTREAGVVVDMLDLIIVNRKGDTRTFRVATSVSLDNVARMIRPR